MVPILRFLSQVASWPKRLDRIFLKANWLLLRSTYSQLAVSRDAGRVEADWPYLFWLDFRGKNVADAGQLAVLFRRVVVMRMAHRPTGRTCDD